MGIFGKPGKYIEYDVTNNMWGTGIISVYVKGIRKEFINVDEYLEEHKDNEDIYCAEDIIDMLKEKYNTKKVKRIEGYNWR